MSRSLVHPTLAVARIGRLARRTLPLGWLLVLLCVSAVARAQSGNVVITSNTTWATGAYNLSSLTVQNGAVLTVGGGSTVTVTGAVVVTANSSMVLQSINNSVQVNNVWVGIGVSMSAASVEVDAGSSLNADGQGYVAGAGPGGSAAGTSAGGSYGGLGGVGNGVAAAAIYGSATNPSDLGSGGNTRCCSVVAGLGGGALTLTVSGTLTNNGIISANGAGVSGVQAGSGSGGTVFVRTGGLAGSGAFTANGGAGGEAGGGGGRVAVYYNGSSSSFTGFSASTASGGICTNNCNNNASSFGDNGTAGFFDTSATNSNLSIYQNFTIPAGTSVSYNTITVQADAVLTIGGGAAVTVANALTVTGTVVAQSLNNTAQVNGAWAGTGVTLYAGSVQVDASGSINTDSQGYIAGAGPGGGGPGGSSAGGSYGGLGGVGNGVAPAPTYGSATAPIDLGSGGGYRCCSAVPGAGGGALILTVSGTLTDNGIISANGGNGNGAPAGGGSGGTVSIQTGTLAGSGSIAATGGSGGEAGGGGGRIALYYNTNSGFNMTLVTANGGSASGGNAGATGTVYSLGAGSNLTISNNTALPAGANLSFSSVTVNNQATLTLGAGTTMTANNITVSAGGSFTAGGGSTLTVNGPVLVTGNSKVVLQSTNNAAQVNGTWAGTGVTLNAGSVEVDAGSSINADGQGYLPNAGPGGAPGGSSAGGSYGGVGGVSNGVSSAPIYGSATTPTDLGSGGGNRCCGAVPGAGGGAVRLIVSGTLTDNGIISANGQNVAGFQAGAGSGGTVYVMTGGLVGSGVFTTNGGAGGEAGGGGGRVAVYYNAPLSSFTGFATSTASAGGCGSTCANGTNSAGGVGTVAFFDTSATNSNLMVDQDLTIPAGTAVSYNSITVQAGAVLTIGGGATVTVANALTVSGTVVAQSINNTAQVNGTWQGTGVTINAGSIQVNTNGSLNADGQGYVAGAGPGGSAAGTSAGGSYGGLGGVGNGVAAAAIYGSATNPSDLGSGGNTRCCSVVAGLGGGALTLTVSGTLTNNGIISANGAGVSGVQAGSGSGGTVFVRTGGLAGSGAFTANGGAGGEAGGGGGRVAVYYNGSSSSFTGFSASTASGGTCTDACNNNASSFGGNGTAAFFDTSATNNNLGVYQNFTIPAGTSVSYSNITVQPGALLTVGGGAAVAVSNALTVTGTLVAQSANSTTQVAGTWQGSGITINAASVQVDATGSINADGQGYVAGAGPGGGGPGGSSEGGSYGGLGGLGDGVPPGPTYGSPTAPTDLGSGGGYRCCSAIPGAGGGALTLAVSGTLTDNGIISANGGNGNGAPAGGGSGGTVSIHTATLVGSGSIAANGGTGGEAGGGGGRIAVYYNTNSGFNLTQVTSNGGIASAGNSGAAGTVYTLGAGSNLTVSNNTALPANANLTYSSVTINNQGSLTLGAGTTMTANNITVSAGGSFTVGGGSTLTVNGPVLVTGNSNVVLQGLNNTGQINGVWAGVGVTLIATSIEVDAGSSLNADSQGYVAGAGPGTTPGGTSAGGSYGGLGAPSNGVSPGATYGSATTPTDLGSGSNTRCCGAIAGAGGGAMRLIVSGALTDNGIISANGGNVIGLQAGGGSGGSAFIVTGNLTGTGSITANGGAGGEAGGGGGRIAIYYLTNSGFNPASITAAGGSNGSAGTVDAVNGPTSVFLQPTESVIHGTAPIQWFSNIGGSSTVTLAGPQTATVATSAGDIASTTFDTTQLPDGSYQLVLSVLNNAGQGAQQVEKNVVINNSVEWHSGTLTASQTWGPTPVQALDGDVIVPSGVTLTIAPGTVVKALAGAQIIVQNGGTLIAGGTANAPVTFTTFDDYTIGGNTDFNQGISVPDPGEWNGIAVLGGGTFTSNTNTVIRYAETTLSGSLGASTTLYSTQVYTVSGTLVVPAGVTLNIQPGAILKFDAGAGMDVQPGATLTANGTLAQPIYFTSVNDISIGGDTNNNGGSVMPAPGDWDSIILDGATVSMQHVQMQYGGGPLNSGAQAGMIETTDNANVTISDSVLAYSFFIGIQTGYPNGGGDTVTVTNTTFYGIEDRAINAYGGSTVHVVNDTIDGNAAGVFAHGGTIDVENSIISNSLGTQFGGIQACCGGVFSTLMNNDVYTTASGAGNYVGVNDPTGTQGNISANPVYLNGTLHDYRPTYGSPAIDAANGTVPNYPFTDAFGLARYSDPLVTTKTGTADVNGNYPDMGAFEFVQTAPSDLDLTASNVQGPAAVIVGTQVLVTWTVTNIGSGTAYGPWHDAVYLVTDPNTNPVETFAGMALEGAGVVLGPGASYNASATIMVPGTVVGRHRWEVKTNVRGEIFEGANTGNNTGIALNPVEVDLTQLVPGATPLSGSFAGVGQSAFYKVIPDTTQATKVQLALNSGQNGSVQLFVGAGYVPSPQDFDYQQVEFNSASASVVIPSGSTQIYYVTAYAQTLPVSPAAYSIQASAVQFSLTSISPAAVYNGSSQTIGFVGGGFTSNTVFTLVGSSGTVYTPSSTFIADTDHADLTFNLAGVPAGSYSATASNGATATLPNALVVNNQTVALSPGLDSGVNLWLETPEAFRAGFPAQVTLYYENVSGEDIAAPLIWLTAAGSTLSKQAPPCAGCNPNFGLMYQSTETSGAVLGLNNQGPAGVLPNGAQGSINFIVNPTGNSVTFNAQALSQFVPDILIGYTIYHGNLDGCTAGPAICDRVIPTGLFGNAPSLCAAYTPPYNSPAGFTRTCMQLLNKAGFTNALCSVGIISLEDCSTLDGSGINRLLAQDATQLSSIGIYENDAVRMLAYEFQIDGSDIFSRRYHQGAFGYGASHSFDITATSLLPGAAVISYPDGSARSFPTINPANPNQSLGIPGDYGVLTTNTDGSATLTERDGTIYEFGAATPAAGSTKLAYIQDANGNRVTFSYNSVGLLTTAADSFGETVSYTYDSLGHITQITDPVGRSTTYTYDIANDALHSTFLTSITNVNGTTSLAWNESGAQGVGYMDDSCVATYCGAAIGVNTITYPDGTHSYYTYDALGRVASQSRDGGAQTITYTYGAQGLLTITDALGNTTQVQPNQYGVPGEIIDPLQNVTQYIYDSEQRNTAVQGPLGTRTLIGYDSTSDVALTVDPLGNRQSFAYNSFGSLQSFTDASGNTTTVNYDLHNNPLSVAGPDGKGPQSTYDAHGNVTSLTNARGHSIQYTYNPVNLLTSKTYSNGSQVTYTYDNHDNLLTSTASNGVTTYSYDSADRLTGVLYPNGQYIHYSYNTGGQPSGMIDSSGFTALYVYDAAGRLSTLTSGAGAPIASYTYDSGGELIRKTLGNGTYTTYAYDAGSNLLHLANYTSAGTLISRYDYTYDALSRQATLTAPSGSFVYNYDADSQISGSGLIAAPVSYVFDTAGNRISAGSTSYLVNNLNEYTSVGGNAYSYDADGNMISGGGATYTYDDENRLTSMITATDTWTYQYDGLGQRISSTHNGVATQYLIDPSGFGNVAAELNGSGQVIAHYTYGLDLTSSVPASGSPSYYHFDAAGNTTQMTNSSGAVVNSYSYLPFGEKVSSSVNTFNPFTYVGEFGVMDEGSGLYYMRNRYYNPTLGRFVQRDPIGFLGGSNLYNYAVNSPTNFVDPMGTCPKGEGEAGEGNAGEGAPGNGTSGSVLGDADATVNSHREAQQAAYDSGIASQSVKQLDENVEEGGKQIVEVGAIAIGSTLPELPLPGEHLIEEHLGGTAAYAAGVAANHYGPHALVEKGINKAFGPSGGSEGDCPPKKSYLVPVLKDMANYFSFGYLFAKQPENTTTKPVDKSIDPNGKLTSGYGADGYVPDDAAITYTVYFENQPAATAPAVIVTVTDPLASNLDWSTVQINNISFNNVSLTVPAAATTYSTQTAVSTDPNPVNVTTGVNPATGVLTVTMQSVDPITGSIPANPTAGFLPPNNSANSGTGSVTFTVSPKKGLANGTAITNQASIVFDTNAAIATNTVTNTLDTSAVTSSINPLPATTTSNVINVGWTGSDPTGSGIASYNIYVSMDGEAYSLWLSATTLNSSTYTGIAGHSYAFTSVATNNVGIVQASASTPQTIAIVFITPTVTVTPASSSITTAQSLGVTIAVANPTSGGTVPSGTVTLVSGGYTSAAATLTGGAATITIPAGALANGVDTLTVTYTPDTTGSSLFVGATGTAQVTVGSVITLSVSLTPSSLAFTSISGTTSTAQTAQLSNTGNAAVSITGISFTGAGASSFAQTNNCGTSLAVGANCTITVTFTPSSVANFSAMLSVADSATGSPQTVSLSGTGTPVPAPVATIAPSSLTFTSTAGTTSAVQTAQLSNTGSAALNITGISFTGTGASSFAQTNNCGTSLAAGSSCAISVTFTPSAAASFSAMLSVADDAIGSPQTVTLSGTGTPAPAPIASINPTTLTFTSASGSTSAAQTAQLSNTGNAALSITGITLTGANAGSFAQTNTCGTSLAPSSNCTISVTFTPTSAGSFSASVSIADNATGSPQMVALTGTGTASATFQLSATPPSQSVIAGGSVAYTINVTPQGGAFTSAVTLTASGLPPGATASFAPSSVTPSSAGASSILTVQTAKTSASLRPEDWSSTKPMLALVGFLFLFARKRRRPVLYCLLAFASLAGLASLSGCGGSSPAAVNYTITVTATSGSLVQTSTVVLIVQP